MKELKDTKKFIEKILKERKMSYIEIKKESLENLSKEELIEIILHMDANSKEIHDLLLKINMAVKESMT